jgi:2-keto-4-pentenoate hydratase/2-oxohepta-3-ene-1,7-dioic acid hydratase in catechol pathway
MRLANVVGRAAIVVDGESFDVETLSGGAIRSEPMSVIEEHWAQVRELVSVAQPGEGVPVGEVRLGPPVPAPRSIFGLVANYPPSVLPSPVVPMVFGKFPSAVTGPFDDIRLPDPACLPMKSEWTVLEAELAVVIGAGGRRIPAARALECVAGYMVAQDITERVHEFGPRGTSVGTMDYESLKSLGKSMDSFCPLGPVLVTLDEFEDPLALDIRCRLNGVVVQEASTAELLIGVAELVSFLSAFVTLRPGDIILTGTPTPLSGTLPRLCPGDVIETEISGIGTLVNHCIADTEGPPVS